MEGFDDTGKPLERITKSEQLQAGSWSFRWHGNNLRDASLLSLLYENKGVVKLQRFKLRTVCTLTTSHKRQKRNGARGKSERTHQEQQRKMKKEEALNISQHLSTWFSYVDVLPLVVDALEFSDQSETG